MQEEDIFHKVWANAIEGCRVPSVDSKGMFFFLTAKIIYFKLFFFQHDWFLETTASALS